MSDPETLAKQAAAAKEANVAAAAAAAAAAAMGEVISVTMPMSQLLSPVSVPTPGSSSRKNRLKNFEGTYYDNQFFSGAFPDGYTSDEPIKWSVKETMVESHSFVLHLYHPDKVAYRIVQAIADGQRMPQPTSLDGSAIAAASAATAASVGVNNGAIVSVEDFIAPAFLPTEDPKHARLVFARTIDEDTLRKIETQAQQKNYSVTRQPPNKMFAVSYCTKCNRLHTQEVVINEGPFGKPQCPHISEGKTSLTAGQKHRVFDPDDPGDVKRKINELRGSEAFQRTLIERANEEIARIAAEIVRLEEQLAEV